ncbi:aminopeptidase PepB [Glaciecola sp. 1036]|uniref:aminopeptidase PepB n=1 Tax=Alteromonadaceae TaxID=72275 RepID=UPI003D09518D
MKKESSINLYLNVEPTQPSTLYSLSENAITINATETSVLDDIRKGTRKFLSLGFTSVKLEGSWSREQQYAVIQAFYSPKQNLEVKFASETTDDDRQWLLAHKKALYFVRSLTNETPENLSPEILSKLSADWLVSLVDDPLTVSVKEIIGNELAEQEINGIYAVGRGSERPPVLLEVDFNPIQEKDVSCVLVGKGITFDSGGYSLKSSEGMLDMKCDMGGAATVVGALGLAIMLGLQKRVKLYLCCAENLVSGHAYKLGDILKYKNDLTVEIVNTDAEGRLVLADGLIAACENNPSLIIDAATLTGAAVMAVGGDYNALFSLNKELAAKALNFACNVNEPLWQLPLTLNHQFKCPSPFADTANSRPQKGGGAGGASNAAGFLSRFVEGYEGSWLHFDLAAAYNRNGTEIMPEGATGLGVRTISEILIKNF